MQIYIIKDPKYLDILEDRSFAVEANTPEAKATKFCPPEQGLDSGTTSLEKDGPQDGYIEDQVKDPSCSWLQFMTHGGHRSILIKKVIKFLLNSSQLQTIRLLHS